MPTLNRAGLIKLFNAPFITRTQLALDLKISRPWLYAIAYDTRTPSPRLVEHLNARIAKLLHQITK
jgi:hypothetical protein